MSEDHMGVWDRTGTHSLMPRTGKKVVSTACS